MSDVTPLSPPALSVSVFFIALGRRSRENVERRLREYGLSYHHFSALGHLGRQPGLSYSELARRAHVTTQSMQTTVGHLEHLGLVDRGETATQGRRADLTVTQHGVGVLRQAEQAIRAVDDELTSELDTAERGRLERALLQLFISQPIDTRP